ncbi:MAG: efflux RND transporter periplasmic adaptor subunit [Bacteroidetes bacterium]|nr:efflux RND transporter periplasmic adaptor subunit [Bacteroidota bacterium]
MKKLIYFPLVMLVVACGSKNSLEAKKKQLAEYNTQMETLKKDIADLEKEIAKMDTSQVIKNPKLVTVSAIEAGSFSHYIDLQGTVEAHEDIAVMPGMPGIVTAVYVKEGDLVSKGQVLGETDNRAMRESLAQLRTTLELAKTTYEKQERLWNQKIGSEIQYLQAKTQYESLTKSIESMEAQIDMTRMKAPIAGIIDQVNVKVGEYAAPGMMGAFNVVNFNRMKVTAKAADSYIQKIKVGDPVKIQLNDIGKTIESKISFVSKVVNPMSRTFLVEIELGKTESNVRPNMFASLSINDETADSVIAVSSNMVQKDANEQQYVFVASGNDKNMNAKKRLVSTGISYGDQVVITEGLNPGDKIITSGYSEIVDGQSITLK